eukprot:scaffold2488_cov209-Ochromonas_danica.AAC.1
MVLVRRPPNTEAQDGAQVEEEEFVPSSVTVVSDLLLSLPTPTGIKTFVLDVAMGNPAAPRYFRAGKAPHLHPDAVNRARDQEKIAHYNKDTTLVAQTPRRFYTFDVEATGRLGPSALAFLQDFHRSAGIPYVTEGIHARFGPSPVMKLLRNIVPAVARIIAKLSKTYTKFIATSA